MKTVRLSYPLSPEIKKDYATPQVVAIGQFDGVHLGHASVISTAVRQARQEGIPAAVMTFHPHPKDVMKKENYEGYLTPLHEKQQLLEKLGVELLYVIEFNEDFSRLSPEQFVADMLIPLGAKAAVVGFDFRFGHKGAGNAETLQQLGADKFKVETVPPFLLDGAKVSSSEIRNSLQTGRLEQADHLLGRHYVLRGTVIGGDKRGRTIGFPTANLSLDDSFVVPAKGVYAVRALYENQWLPGVMNLGVKPTFHEGVTAPSFEVHLFHFNKEIYGEHLTVELVHYIREEKKFPSVPELIAQIQADAKKAEELLASMQ